MSTCPSYYLIPDEPVAPSQRLRVTVVIATGTSTVAGEPLFGNSCRGGNVIHIAFIPNPHPVHPFILDTDAPRVLGVHTGYLVGMPNLNGL